MSVSVERWFGKKEMKNGEKSKRKKKELIGFGGE